MKSVVDEKSLSYNPPFAYTIKVLDSQIITGLGNGTILKFKKKKLQLDEVYSDIHSDQITGILAQGDKLLTASNDLTIAMHQRGQDKLIEKSLVKVSVDTKFNDVVGAPNCFYTAGVNGQVSKYTIK